MQHPTSNVNVNVNVNVEVWGPMMDIQMLGVRVLERLWIVARPQRSGPRPRRIDWVFRGGDGDDWDG